MVYFTHMWLIFMVNVGKYTSPMDPMGYIASNEVCGFNDVVVFFQDVPSKFDLRRMGASNTEFSRSVRILDV